jgi:hypothetical protein
VRAPQLAVPAYFHPEREAHAWALLAGRATAVGLVVVNPCSGAGDGTDTTYRTLCTGPWRSAIAGYVDTAYATRPVADVVEEALAYRRHYGVDAVFADQVTSGAAHLGYYRELTARLRAAGCARIVLNPGTVPDPGYLELADIVVTFEDTAEAYARPLPSARPARRRSATSCTTHPPPPTAPSSPVRPAGVRPTPSSPTGACPTRGTACRAGGRPLPRSVRPRGEGRRRALRSDHRVLSARARGVHSAAAGHQRA